jgi:hypothetical protein
LSIPEVLNTLKKDLPADYETRLTAYNIAKNLQVLKRMLRKFPQLAYIPNPAQDKFHCSTARGRGCFWPNRVGKTVALVNEAHAHAMGFRIWYPRDHPARNVNIGVPNVGRLYVNDYKAWERDVEKEWVKWVPPGTYRFTRNTQGNVTKIVLDNRSVIHVMSYEQAPRASEGGQIDWACFNEPCPKVHFTATLRGLVDTNGPWWMCMTLLEDEPWIYDEIWEGASGDANMEIIEATIEDNLLEHGGVLERAHVEEFAKFLPEDEKAARLYGKPIFAQGRVFKAFHNSEPWVTHPIDIPPHWPRFCAIDPHDRKPIAVLWAAVDPETGTVYAYDELYDATLNTIEKVAEAIKLKEKEHGTPKIRWMDPSGTKPEKTSGANVQATFAKYGILCTTWSRQDKAVRIIRTRHWFECREKGNQPTIVVFDHCKCLIYELSHYVYDRSTGKPVKRNDDLIDCLMAFANADIVKLSWRASEPRKLDVSWLPDDWSRVKGPREGQNVYEGVTGY